MVKRTENVKKSHFKANNTKFMAAKASKQKGNGSAFTKSAASSNPNRPDPSGGKKGSQFRTKATINRINMYKAKPDMAKMKMKPTDPQAGRIHPDRRWFGNVRTVDQKELEKYRQNLETQQVQRGSGVSVLVRNKKLPLSLVKDAFAGSTTKGERLLQVESFQDTFGGASRRKKANIGTSSLAEMLMKVNEVNDDYNPVKDVDLHKHDKADFKHEKQNILFSKGQSKRIWEELYKVIDSSDVLLYVLDGRDPNGTRTKFIEHYLKTKCPNKHLVFILNKCDLIPTSVTQKWVKYLSKTCPTLAFQASINSPFGKGSLIQLLKQFDILHRDKKNISVGMIGYPNVGKSSIINALMKKACCKVAPIPGQTKVWQYITLTKRIYLVDCPGIVNDENQTEQEKVMKSIVRAEKIPDPAQYIQGILDKAEKKHIYDVYGIPEWNDSEDFLKKYSRKTGKLLKGGEPDYNNISRQIIVDWQRGNIPYFNQPPKNEEEEQWENKIINEQDPEVQNPLMKINEEVALTNAQNEMIDQIAKIRDSVNLENEQIQS